MTYLTIDEARGKLGGALSTIETAEKAYRIAIEDSADAEAVYRDQLGTAFKKHRDAGEAVEVAKILAHKDVVKFSRERDFAAGRVKEAAEKLENARDSRRSLWRIIEWSSARDVASARAQQAAGTSQMAMEAIAGKRWP